MTNEAAAVRLRELGYYSLTEDPPFLAVDRHLAVKDVEASRYNGDFDTPEDADRIIAEAVTLVCILYSATPQ